MKQDKVIWSCPTQRCGYKTKPQSASIIEMGHRCGKGKKYVSLKPTPVL